MSKKVYQSKYTNNKVTAAQYLCDEICDRLAKKVGKTLPYKYWNLSEWNKVYKWQIVAANDLLNEVDVVAIMTFLRSKKGQKILSLGQKKQILEGCQKNKLSDIILDKSSQEIQDMVWDTDLDIEENIEIKEKPSVSLWEKLG